MEDIMKKVCSPTSSRNCGRIIGTLFLIVGSGLTLLTYSDAGILGFFIAGTIFCIKSRPGCSPCGGCGSCGCCCGCGPEGNWDPDNMPVVTAPTIKKVAKPRKTKKTV
jgi:hypothetical protein